MLAHRGIVHAGHMDQIRCPSFLSCPSPQLLGATCKFKEKILVIIWNRGTQGKENKKKRKMSHQKRKPESDRNKKGERKVA